MTLMGVGSMAVSNNKQVKNFIVRAKLQPGKSCFRGHMLETSFVLFPASSSSLSFDAPHL